MLEIFRIVDYATFSESWFMYSLFCVTFIEKFNKREIKEN